MCRSALRLLSLIAVIFVWQSSASEEFAPDRVLVRYKPGLVIPQSHSRLGLTLAKQVGRQRTQVYRITNGNSVNYTLEQLRSIPGIEAISPDYIQRPVAVNANDPSFSRQWHLQTTKATSAWASTVGSGQVKVCIIDTGAQPDHPDLAANIVKGFSTIDGEDPNNFNDDVGHGTHVAGIVAAVGNNSVGVSGVAWKLSLVICRFMNENGGYTSDAMECYDKCRQEGALITTNSYGSYGGSSFESDALLAGAETGNQLLACAASGNSAFNSDILPMYPAAYKLDNIISVGATAQSDAMASYSNFGRTSVDLFAPGSGILSTYPGSQYATMSGTSMAAPVVAGAAALLKAAAAARGVTLSNAELKQYLLAGVDKFPRFTGLSVTGGRLNVDASLQLLLGALGDNSGSDENDGEDSGDEGDGDDAGGGEEGGEEEGGEDGGGEEEGGDDGGGEEEGGDDGGGEEGGGEEEGGDDGGGGGGPVRRYRLKQLTFERVRYGCKKWQSRSETAYRNTIHDLLGAGADKVWLNCQRRKRNNLRIVIKVQTPRISQAEATHLSQQLNDAVEKGQFRKKLRSRTKKAKGPFKAGRFCVLQLSRC